MKKCQGLLNHILYLKKKNNPNRSIDSSTSTNMNKIIKYNTKVNKIKQKGSLNKTELHNVVNEIKQNDPPQNYINQSKVKAQNHSFTTTLSSETLFLHLSNKKSPTSHNQKFDQPPQPQQRQETQTNKIAFMQSMNTKSNSTYYNKMKHKIIASTFIQDKQPSNVSFYQLHKGLLSNIQKTKDKTKGRQYLNKSMSNYEEEWHDNKESHSNAMQSRTLINKIKAIEKSLAEGLVNFHQSNEGKIMSNVKSYSLYRTALEDISKELPKDYHTLLSKIINGYHHIILSFVSDQKKIIENYDELKTKYSSISRELSAYKTQTNNMGSDHNKNAKRPIEVKTIQFLKNEGSSNVNSVKNKPIRHQNLQDANNYSIYGHTTGNNTSNKNNNYIEPLKYDLFQYNIEEDLSVSNTLGNNVNKNIQMNKIDFEDLEGLYFSDRVDMGNNSPINVTTNVPKLSLDFLG